MDILDNIRIIIKENTDGPADILMFYPLKNEVDLLPLFPELVNMGHRIYFPVTQKESMDFFEVKKGTDFSKAFKAGALSVMEPVDRSAPYIYGQNNAICLTPGRKFSKNLERKGRGAGYYDRFFADKPDILKVGIAMESMVVEKLDTQPWDVDMDIVVTEIGFF